VSSDLWCVPNLLSLSRLPLAAGLCACLSFGWWAAGLVTFCVAAATDWLDGWWARRYGPQTAAGRHLDPLTDKVLIGSAFIFLIRVPDAGIEPWMVAVVVVRELLVTGLRGIVEATGKTFGADWFGKLKTVLQCAVLVGVLLVKTLAANEWLTAAHPTLSGVTTALVWAMLAATVGSALQYGWKAAKLLR
jgi:CDP-diacylglycerol--glycerol-3-phosphate 3-phosphatidyltransferase